MITKQLQFFFILIINNFINKKNQKQQLRSQNNFKLVSLEESSQNLIYYDSYTLIMLSKCRCSKLRESIQCFENMHPFPHIRVDPTLTWGWTPQLVGSILMWERGCMFLKHNGFSPKLQCRSFRWEN